MENIKIERFPLESAKVNKYKRILDNILCEGEKKLEQRAPRISVRSQKRNRWRFKSCPRCHGDLNSCYGEDFSCFQCGYICYSWVNKSEVYKGGYHGKTKESQESLSS